MQIILANPRGFCAGVDRAIEIVNRALELFGAPIYVRHEVVHNKFVVDDLKGKGAIFVEELSEIPQGATVIFSAHGVSQAVRDEAKTLGFQVFDATCPLVTKVHMEVARIAKKGESCVLVGHKGHPEVEGTMGQYLNSTGKMYLVESEQDVATLTVDQPNALHYCTQTTLSVDETKGIISALRIKFPNIQGPRKDDICYATQNRQDAVRDLAKEVELVLVVGSKNSSNSNRLRELAQKEGVASYLIDGPEDIEPSWFVNISSVGVTAGASAPEVLVKQVIQKLQALGGEEVTEASGALENITFALPIELR